MVRRNYLNQPETAGMLIDLDDGYIHMLGSTIKNNQYEPDHPEGQTAQAEVLLSTGVLNGIPDAYFKIRSKQQINKDHYLIYIDSDKYYLQTDDYSEVDFNEGDGGISNTGSGLRLDLKDGVLNGYNFRLSSKNVMINSSDKSTAFFIIKNDDGNNLFYAGPDNYYLKSNDFESMSDNSLGSGLKLTLMNFPGSPSGIEAYNFDLRAGNVNGDHAIILSDSGNPYFMVNADANGTTKTLVNISKTEQSFQSSDYNGIDTGIRLSLSGKELKAYSGFLLKAYSENHSGNFISINANAAIGGHPLQVSNNFKVDWAGNLYCNGMNATNANLTGTLNVGESLIVKGTLTGGIINGATIQGGILKVGPTAGTTGYQLYADKSGVTIQNAKIINCDIQSGDGAPTGTGGFSVTPSGIMTGFGCNLTNGMFTTCTVKELLTCNGDISLSGRNMLYFGDKGAYLSFSDQSLNTNASFYVQGPKLACKTIGCNKIEGSAYIAPGEGGDIIVAANLNAENHSIVAQIVTVKGTLWIGTDTLEQYIKNILSNVTISLSGSYVTDNGNNTASISIPYSGKTSDNWLGWDDYSTGRIYSTEYGTDSGSASNRTYYTKSTGQSYSGTSKTTVTATINVN